MEHKTEAGNEIPKITIKPNQGAGGLSTNSPQDSKAYRPACVLDLANLPVNHQIFIELLKERREIKAEDFVNALRYSKVNIKDTRELRIMKEELIEAGFPIGSAAGRGCYFWICNAKDENDACNELVSKAKTMLVRANQIKKNVQKFYNKTPDPMTLFQIEERMVR